jgi:RimJ/RimL family protein N-acetyltransferase
MARLSDVAAIMSAEREHPHQVTPETEAEHRAHMQSARGLAFVHEVDGNFIGFTLLVRGSETTFGDGVVELKRIVMVRPGRGFGRRAIVDVLDHCFGPMSVDVAVDQVWLDVVVSNTRARALYASLGFIDEPGTITAEIGDQQVELVICRLRRDGWLSRAHPALP